MSFVPVIDISADPRAVGAELDEICRTAGFFQVTGHGVPSGVAGRAWTAATRFFDLPPEDKLSVARPTPDYPYGYIPLAGESLSQSMTGTAPPDLKEVFNAGPPARPDRSFADPGEAWAYSPSLWPAALPELKNGADLTGGVAVWAHLGGFVTGVLLVKIFENRRLVIRRTTAA